MIDAASFANLISYSAQIACIVAIGALLPTVLRLDAPAVRYNYWRGLALLCLALPWLQERLVRSAAPQAPLGPFVADEGVTTADELATVASGWSPDWWSIAAIVLLAGAVIRLAWIGVGLIQLRRLRRAGTVAGASAELDELQRTIGTRAEVRYLDDVIQPVTFGVLRPIVLLPSTLRDHPEDVRRAVIAHELFHVQRRDWAWVLVEELVRAAFWFHPAVWWLISRVQLAREEVVDELAVLMTGRRRTYVEALLAFADETPLAPAAAFARRRHLFRRMMLISREAAMSSKRILASCAVMALVVALGSWYAVDAFPLVSPGQSTLQKTPGPLEQKAVPITAENPIPRRISSVNAEYPGEAAAENARGNVVLKLTLDASGRIAETRVTGLRLRMGSRNNVVFQDTAQMDMERFLERSATMTSPGARRVVDAFVREAVEAVQQWQYETPYQAPISFNVTIGFAPPGEAPAAGGGGGRGGVVGSGPIGGIAAEPGWTADGAVRVGGSIKAPTKIQDVKPVYPPVAQEARVSGVVILEVRIEPDGSVSQARVLRSIPLLDEAAVEAVMQWRFTPTLLNGQAIPVMMTVTVNFTLQ
jgi:protein TonB